jgi:hypothetical protein
MDPEAVFEHIRVALKSEVRVVPKAPIMVLGVHRKGYYSPKDKCIWVRHDLHGVHRLATLVHEVGHHHSNTKGWPEAYQRAIADADARDHWHGYDLDEQRAVLNEEVLAWQYGIALAETHGFDDRAALVDIARSALEFYRSRLDLAREEFNVALQRVAEPGES